MDGYSSSSPFLGQYGFSTTDSSDDVLCSLFPEPDYNEHPNHPNPWRNEPTMESQPLQNMGMGPWDMDTSTPNEDVSLQYLRFPDSDFPQPSMIEPSDPIDNLSFSEIDYSSARGPSSIGVNMTPTKPDPQGLSGMDDSVHGTSSSGVNMPTMIHHPHGNGGCWQEGITSVPCWTGNTMDHPDWNGIELYFSDEMHNDAEEVNCTNCTGPGSNRNDVDFNDRNDSSFGGREREMKLNQENPTAVLSNKVVDCRGCQLMREVVHAKGGHTKKLSVHGSGNQLYHALYERECVTEGNLPVLERTYTDLRGYSYQSFKRFITNYGLLRAREGYHVIRDSLPAFVDALCTPISFDSITMSNPETCFSEPVPVSSDKLPAKKTGIAAQRERTGKLHIRDLANYFHFPIEYAAKKLNLCVTVLKKICRRYGMERWPYRKIKGIDRKILKLKKKLQSGEGDPSTSEEIEKLNDVKTQIYDCCGASKCQKQEKSEPSPPDVDRKSGIPDKVVKLEMTLSD